MADTPPRDDGTTATCIRCGRPFTPAPLKRYCSAMCRVAGTRERSAARKRQSDNQPPYPPTPPESSPASA